jgi:hypothetical protein
MFEEYNYQFNCRQYVLHRGNTPLGSPLDEVSICLDTESGVMLKHGTTKMVTAYINEAQAKLQGSSPEWADALVLVTGRFALEDPNKCITTTGYAGLLWEKAKAGTLEQVPMFG